MQRIMFLIAALLLQLTALIAEEQKPERSVDQEELHRLIKRADRIVVKETPRSNAKVLFESKKREDIESLASSLTIIKPEEGFYCACLGEPAVYLYSSDQKFTLLTNHHGRSIRTSFWDSDAKIADPDAWVQWFEKRKIHGPRKELEGHRARLVKFEKDRARWLAAMPKGIQPLWERSIDQFGSSDPNVLRGALESTYPDRKERIRALLYWFGSGAGPWSGFPSYEDVAEKLLLDFKPEDIVSSIEITETNPKVLEGAARYFGGWPFSQHYPEGLKQVPAELKKALWIHVKNTQDKDKLGRAKHAFK